MESMVPSGNDLRRCGTLLQERPQRSTGALPRWIFNFVPTRGTTMDNLKKLKLGYKYGEKNEASGSEEVDFSSDYDRAFGNRSSRVIRSPPLRERSFSLPEVRLERAECSGDDDKDELSDKEGPDLVLPPLESASNMGSRGSISEEYSDTEKRKRKKGDSPEKRYKRDRRESKSSPQTLCGDETIVSEEDWRDLRMQLEALRVTVSSLEGLSKAKNTKVEIKQGTGILVEQVNAMTRTFAEVETRRRPYEAEGHSISKTYTDAGIQVDAGEIKNAKIKAEEARLDRLARIGRLLRGVEREGETLTPSALEEEWPEEFFSSVKLIRDENLKEYEGDVVLLIKNTDEPTAWARSYMARFPELQDLCKGIAASSQVETLQISTTVQKGGSSIANERKRVIYLAVLGENINPSIGKEAFYKRLKACVDGMKMKTRSEIVFSIPDEIDTLYTRKVLEVILRGRSCTATLIGGNKNVDRKRTLSAPTQKRKEETLIVKGGGKSFAELVKGIKDKVDIKEVGVTVRSLKKAANGDLVLKIEGDKEKAINLRETIKDKIQGTEVNIRMNSQTLFITDIDVSMTELEVVTALKEKMRTTDIKFVSMKPTRDGNQVATVEVPSVIARQWAEKGRINLGWVSCRIRGKLSMLRCYKCLEFGHRRLDCKGPDRSLDCMRCGKAGHKAIDCSSPPFCGKCNREGHRSDARACPALQKYLADTQNRQKELRKLYSG